MTGRSKTKSLIYTAFFAVVIVICTWIQVPAAVPFTLQTFAVFAATLMLGWKRALAAVAVYVALGVVGLPVFSGFRGGFGALAGPTGGYIVGFFFIPISFLLTSIKPGSKLLEIGSLIIGLVICYAFGTAWFVVVYAKNGGGISFASALALCVLPYIIPDLAKLALAFFLASKVKKRVNI